MTTYIKRLPEKGYLDSNLWVPKAAINVEGTKQALTVVSADKHAANVSYLYKESDHHLVVPRNYFDLTKVPFEVVDCRPQSYPVANIISRIVLDKLRPTLTVQRDACNAMLASNGGIIQMACGLGKTETALHTISLLRVPSLIAVPDTSLMEQWQERIAERLDVPDGVGLMMSGKFDWQRPIVLATYHTLAAAAALMPEEVRRWFGAIFFDEGHHVPAPTWAAAASLFYCRRYILSATPERDDGMHVINDMHVGPVLFKYMKQDLVPRIEFRQTGFRLDLGDKATNQQINDITGELHLGRLAGFLGRCLPRLEYILELISSLEAQGRRILVVSNSIEELVNLVSLRAKARTLLDYPLIDAASVGFKGISPQHLDKPTRDKNAANLKRILLELEVTIEKLKVATSPHRTAQLHRKLAGLEATVAEIERATKQHECHTAIERAEEKQLRAHLKYLAGFTHSAGLLIGKVKAETRLQMLREKTVVFSIAKYGREGLDEKRLDTVLVLEPMSSEPILKQLIGRILRLSTTIKQEALAIFLEDNIIPHQRMCQKLRGHLNRWPEDEGGPLTFHNILETT